MIIIIIIIIIYKNVRGLYSLLWDTVYVYTHIYIYIYIYIYIWRVQMQKPLSAIWNFLLKWAFLSCSYIYVQLFHFNA